MGEKAIEYLFIYDGKTWWLKLTEAEQIADYHKKTAGSRYEGAINLYRKLRQKVIRMEWKRCNFAEESSWSFRTSKKEDIRIKQFNGGQHWYAYIGDMQIRDGNQLKWNTKEAAQAAAEAMVGE